MISAAMCWASAALPPLPMMSILPPADSAASIAAAIFCATSSSAASCVARCSAPSEASRCVAIGSELTSWHCLDKLKTVVLAASRGSKVGAVATLRGDACSHLSQNFLRGGDHVAGSNRAHAGVVVHGADGALAGLAGRRRPGLDRGCKAV